MLPCVVTRAGARKRSHHHRQQGAMGTSETQGSLTRPTWSRCCRKHKYLSTRLQCTVQTDPKLKLMVTPGAEPRAPCSFPDLCTSITCTVCGQRPHQSHRSDVCCDTALLLRESRKNTSLTLSTGPQRTNLPSSGQEILVCLLASLHVFANPPGVSWLWAPCSRERWSPSIFRAHRRRERGDR